MAGLVADAAEGRRAAKSRTEHERHKRPHPRERGVSNRSVVAAAAVRRGRRRRRRRRLLVVHLDLDHVRTQRVAGPGDRDVGPSEEVGRDLRVVQLEQHRPARHRGVLGDRGLSRSRRSRRRCRRGRVDILNDEVHKGRGGGARGWVILVAGALLVHAQAIHPQHVARAPVAEHRGHARRQGVRQLLHVLVLREPHRQRARLSILCQLDLHSREAARVVGRESYRDPEWPVGVNAAGRRPVLRAIPVPRTIPIVASTTIARTLAAAIVPPVQRRMPGVDV
mmetsp:Transcript_75249/g.194009  ORF Transcript_75249/g.194009 Transcript_75249/m.194009 type:complete len:280 (+) Transcript_75249:275-1114(+)